MNYRDFLVSKIKKHSSSGFEITADFVEENYPYLFDWQKYIIPWLVKKGRAALFLDTGLGKTVIQLVWADIICRVKKGRVIILAPLAVSAQTVREGEQFGIKVNCCRCSDDVTDGVNITNYERLSRFDTSEFIGIVLDESSILKSYMGAEKLEIMRLCGTLLLSLETERKSQL